MVRLPDWWKARPRPQVTLSIGKGAPSALGIDAMLDFSVELTLDGQTITAQELATLRASAEGLFLLKGRWVEADAKKLEEVLTHWRAVQRGAVDGVSFIEGMRLLAGAAIAGDPPSTADRQWTRIEAGPWLEGHIKRKDFDGYGCSPASSSEPASPTTWGSAKRFRCWRFCSS
jgi:non-specific serine/threonine protein kinase